VICIDDRAGFYMEGVGLVAGRTYTVKEMFDYGDGTFGVNVGTMVNPPREDAWIHTRFVPARLDEQPAIRELEVCQS